MSRSQRFDAPSYIANASLKTWGKVIKLHLEAIRSTTARSRFVLMANVVTSASFVLIVFSYMLSWNKSIALADAGTILNPQYVHDLAKQQEIMGWLSTQVYSVPVLGVKILASDVPLIAPPALLILTAWLFYSVRREHFVIGRLLCDIYQSFFKMKHDPDRLLWIQTAFQGVVSNILFNTAKHDRPIKSLNESPILLYSKPGKSEAGQGEGAKESDYSLPGKISRGVARLLMYLPALSIAVVLILQALTFSVIVSSITGKDLDWSELDLRRRWLTGAALLCSLLGGGGVLIITQRINEFKQKTLVLLGDFQKWAFGGAIAAIETPTPTDDLHAAPGEVSPLNDAGHDGSKLVPMTHRDTETHLSEHPRVA